MEMTFAEWEEKFKPLYDYEDGIENAPLNCIWSVRDDGENRWVVNGLRVCNRIGTIITEIPYDGVMALSVPYPREPEPEE